MANINANGSELINCGDGIITLVDEYLTQINNLFDSLSKINQTGWSGGSADAYVGKLPADKQVFVDFGMHLKLYGQVIKNTGEVVKTGIDKWDDK